MSDKRADAIEAAATEWRARALEAEAALVALREAVAVHGGSDSRADWMRLETAAAASPATLAAQVRARVLRETAKRVGEAARTDRGWYVLDSDHEQLTADWLRALADAAERGES